MWTIYSCDIAALKYLSGQDKERVTGESRVYRPRYTWHAARHLLRLISMKMHPMHRQSWGADIISLLNSDQKNQIYRTPWKCSWRRNSGSKTAWAFGGALPCPDVPRLDYVALEHQKSSSSAGELWLDIKSRASSITVVVSAKVSHTLPKRIQFKARNLYNMIHQDWQVNTPDRAQDCHVMHIVCDGHVGKSNL
jgi:hypothetical protein